MMLKKKKPNLIIKKTMKENLKINKNKYILVTGYFK